MRRTTRDNWNGPRQAQRLLEAVDQLILAAAEVAQARNILVGERERPRLRLADEQEEGGRDE
jgi:hypothetical protein